MSEGVSSEGGLAFGAACFFILPGLLGLSACFQCGSCKVDIVAVQVTTKCFNRDDCGDGDTNEGLKGKEAVVAVSGKDMD